MRELVTIDPKKRLILSELFSKHKHGRVLINAVLEGRWGIALTDDAFKPQAAVLLHKPVVSFFGGNPESPVSLQLVQELTPPCMINVDAEEWVDLLIETYGDQLEKRQRFDFSSKRLNIEHIRSFKERVQEGIAVKRINLDLARRLSHDLRTDNHLSSYSSAEDFLTRGVGFCALRGERIVSCASSFTVCHEGIEIEINTHPDFRRRGIATTLAATLIEHCLERGIESHWNAANPISAKFAEKLGYIQKEAYDLYVLLPKAR
jgi:GNAT superfamily N-acetyltransferase